MIVCICNNVSESDICQAVDAGLSSMAELQRDLGVTAGCGACADSAKQVLTAHLERSAIRMRDEPVAVRGR